MQGDFFDVITYADVRSFKFCDQMWPKIQNSEKVNDMENTFCLTDSKIS